MEIFNFTMEILGLRSNRRVSIVYYIALPSLLMGALLMYQISNLGLFEGKGLYKTNVLEGGKPRNVTATKVLEGEGKPRNVTVSKVLEGEGKPQNVPASKVSEGRSQNITASSSGLKNESYMGTKVDSFPITITRVPMEKLLGGLLAPGFDEGTCISRYQSYLYRKASPHKPSPYLISKLRNYEDLHKRCGPHSKSYNKTMTRLIKNNKISFTTRYRVLLVEFRHDMAGLFCEPFPNSSWEFPENILSTSYLKHIQTYESLVQDNMTNTSKWVLPSILYLNLQPSRGHDKLFHCDHGQDLLQKIPALMFLSDQYFAPSLFMTPYFKQELSKMFPEKGTIFHHMGRYLFHPSNKAWRLISSFYDANLAKADEKGLGGLKPWILYRSWGEKIPKLCQQALSMEPCFHHPPKSDCNAKNKVDITSVFPYMKTCEDFGRGVKLVDNHE
ncbi:Galactoside 2-alpha-L-fucosyltransferase [Quillaja saponaria]|uniref:Fucosyltransferase n=1 Tax=Quillaja saponaria TaxID=32244 RepID=A0AAD7LP71_QUISA|nr:Galactoside 2-alpha-L-fucosyltransferase [Quillaja saponaria]